MQRQVGILFFNLLITGIINQPVFLYGSHAERISSIECEEIQLSVTGTQGTPIRNAVVVVEGRRRYLTDDRGRVSIGCPPDLKLPVWIEVSAAGFQTRSQTIRGPSDTGCDIVLNREDAARAGGRDTVSVAELSSEFQERSARLQDEGLDALHRRDYNRAAEYFHHALELTPSSPEIYNNIGVAWARRNDLAKAADWFEKAFALAPFDVVVEGNLGLIRWLQNRCEESYKLLETAIERGYSSASGFYAMGIMALQREHPAEAVRHLSKVNPKVFTYRDLFRSIAFQDLSKPRDALKSRRDFLKRNPVLPVLAIYEPH